LVLSCCIDTSPLLFRDLAPPVLSRILAALRLWRSPGIARSEEIFLFGNHKCTGTFPQGWSLFSRPNLLAWFSYTPLFFRPHKLREMKPVRFHSFARRILSDVNFFPVSLLRVLPPPPLVFKKVSSRVFCLIRFLHPHGRKSFFSQVLFSSARSTISYERHLQFSPRKDPPTSTRFPRSALLERLCFAS